MANFIQNVIQKVVGYGFQIQPEKDAYEAESSRRVQKMDALEDYYEGRHKRPLRVSGQGKDYNVITNHAKVIIDRSVSMLVGPGVTFDLPGEGDTPQSLLITKIYDANKKDILLHDLCQFGGIYGTPAIKIVPDGIDTLTGETTDRLVALNPYNLSIITEVNDIDKVVTFIYRWTDGDTAWRELTERQDNGTWLITTQNTDKSGKWQIVDDPITWNNRFPPIVHGKNLPAAGEVYGHSDIEDIIDLQNKYNESQSNINKILSLQAFSQPYIIGAKWPRKRDDKGNEVVDMSPETALEFPNAGDGKAAIGLLQPSGDLDSSRQFVNDIRRDMYDIAETVDTETIKDRVGALTNFGLHVLYKNELGKNATKQLLYGDLLLRVNNYLLRLHGYEGENANPGQVVFGDPLPEDDAQVMQALKGEKDLGIVSNQTIAKKRGYDWQVEQDRIAQEKQATGNVGANMLRDFLAGKGQ